MYLVDIFCHLVDFLSSGHLFALTCVCALSLCWLESSSPPGVRLPKLCRGHQSPKRETENIKPFVPFSQRCVSPHLELRMQGRFIFPWIYQSYSCQFLYYHITTNISPRFVCQATFTMSDKNNGLLQTESHASEL